MKQPDELDYHGLDVTPTNKPVRPARYSADYSADTSADTSADFSMDTSADFSAEFSADFSVGLGADPRDRRPSAQ